jgi:hypothetical protein
MRWNFGVKVMERHVFQVPEPRARSHIEDSEVLFGGDDYGREANIHPEVLRRRIKSGWHSD